MLLSSIVVSVTEVLVDIGELWWNDLNKMVYPPLLDHSHMLTQPDHKTGIVKFVTTVIILSNTAR